MDCMRTNKTKIDFNVDSHRLHPSPYSSLPNKVSTSTIALMSLPWLFYIFFSGRNILVLCSSTHKHNGNDRQYQYANHTMPRPLRCSSIIKCPYYSQTKATFIVLATLFHHPTPQAPPQPWDRNRTLLPPLFFSELEHCWLRDELEQHKHSAQTLSWDSHL